MDSIGEVLCTGGDDSCMDLAGFHPYVSSKEEYLEYVSNPERFSHWKLRESALIWILKVHKGSGSTWDRILADVSRFL